MKVLLLDLETAPLIGYAWEKYDTTIIEVIKPCEILAVGYTWFDDDEIVVYTRQDETEKELVTRLHRLLSEADVVVAHNGDKFDLRVSNARFLHFGFGPPSPYKTVDTLKIARRYFRLESNKLNDLARYLGVGEKTKHSGWSLWKGCLEGDAKSWSTMATYNAQDVKLLKEVYTLLRPWSTTHPDVSTYEQIKHACPTCNSLNTQRRGFDVLKTKVKQRYKCNSCGHWFRGEYVKVEE